MHSQLLWLLVGHQRLKPLFELLNGHLSAIPILHSTVDGLGRDEDIVHNVDDTVCCDAIFNRDSGEGINFDADESTVSADVNAERLVF